LLRDLPNDHLRCGPSDGRNVRGSCDQSSLDIFDNVDGTLESIFSTSSTNGLADPAPTGDLDVELPASISPTVMTCETDADCEMLPGTYCDRTNIRPADDGSLTGSIAKRCVPLETALLRAFRHAEAPRWCQFQTFIEINAAREACKNNGPFSAQCDACVEIVVPRLRNACDPGNDPQKPGISDGRAICDLYNTAGLISLARSHPFVHVPYEVQPGETKEQAAQRAARADCFKGARAVQTGVGGTYESGPGDAFDLGTLNRQMPGINHLEVMRGREPAEHWDRVRIADVSGPLVVDFFLTPVELRDYPYVAPVRDLELKVFQGPACTQQLARVSGRDIDINATELMTSLTIIGPDEFCVQSRALTEAVQTGVHLRVARR
jgi:hypothetical protein